MNLKHFGIGTAGALAILLLIERERFELHTFALVVAIVAVLLAAITYYRDTRAQK